MSILNPALDVAQLAAEFARRKVIQIQEVLDAPVAQNLDQVLRQRTRWSLTFNRGTENIVLSREQLQSVGPDGARKLGQDCVERAKTGFQFIYWQYDIIGAIKANLDQGSPLISLMEHMNSPYFLEFIARVTGVTSIVKADGQATLYRAGNFLTVHNDLDPTRDRKVAYVLGFTKNWQAHWGGLLEFYDATGNVELGILPRFNSLSLFLVPASHAVTFVAPYANEDRLSVTGWFSAK